MLIHTLAFYLFAIIAVAAGFMVIASRNPVHSVLYLIVVFFNAAGLFVLMGAEFLAMMLVVVYVGAVAVLFLFVVMMLDIDFVELREGFLQYLPIGGLLGLIVLVELIMVVAGMKLSPEAVAMVPAPAPKAADVTNTHALGRVLYTRYVYVFQGAGLVLLVAMIGAIVLTLRQRVGVRKQVISEQVARRRADGVELVKDVPTRQGVRT
ncbi:MAG: NADH-quinone oxidoreductase subunit J [Alphaproteobacteria bacterium]|nr:NADH-quinone oxidoreductase subunit J [Alphaproteobacteria bacterium]